MPKKGYKQTKEHKEKHLAKICGPDNGNYSGKFAISSSDPSYQTLKARSWREHNPERIRFLWKMHKHRRRGAIGGITRQEWEDIKTGSSFRCLKCGATEPTIKLQMDHIIPLKLGGTNTADNIQPLCGPCNRGKFISVADFRLEVTKSL